MNRNTAFFEGSSWFKCNNLGLALVTNLKFYTSVSKGLKLKVRKFCGLILTFVEVTGEKPLGGAFLLLMSKILTKIQKQIHNLYNLYLITLVSLSQTANLPAKLKLYVGAWVMMFDNIRVFDRLMVQLPQLST